MVRRNFSAAWWMAGVLFGLVGVGVVGCGGGGKEGEKKNEAAKPVEVPATGPNGGKFVPLGNKEAYAEVVTKLDTSDPKKTVVSYVSFYIFDATGKKALRSSALEMVVNTKVADKATEHKVPSSSQSTDPPGQSSRYMATDPTMTKMLAAPGAELEIVFTSGDKKLVGKFANDAAPAATGTATGTAVGTKPAGTKPAPKPVDSAASGTKPAGSASPSPSAAGK